VTDTFKATIRVVDGQQAVLLPNDIHLDGDEVLVHQDNASGEVILLPTTRRPTLKEFIAFRDAHPIPDEEWEAFDSAIREARQHNPPSDPDRVLRILLEDS
jgi:virulence-associated protein VagC